MFTEKMQFLFWFSGTGERELEPLKRGERVKKGWEPLMYRVFQKNGTKFAAQHYRTAEPNITVLSVSTTRTNNR